MDFLPEPFDSADPARFHLARAIHEDDIDYIRDGGCGDLCRSGALLPLDPDGDPSNPAWMPAIIMLVDKACSSAWTQDHVILEMLRLIVLRGGARINAEYMVRGGRPPGLSNGRTHAYYAPPPPPDPSYTILTTPLSRALKNTLEHSYAPERGLTCIKVLLGLGADPNILPFVHKFGSTQGELTHEEAMFNQQYNPPTGRSVLAVAYDMSADLLGHLMLERGARFLPSDPAPLSNILSKVPQPMQILRYFAAAYQANQVTLGEIRSCCPDGKDASHFIAQKINSLVEMRSAISIIQNCFRMSLLRADAQGNTPLSILMGRQNQLNAFEFREMLIRLQEAASKENDNMLAATTYQMLDQRGIPHDVLQNSFITSRSPERGRALLSAVRGRISGRNTKSIASVP